MLDLTDDEKAALIELLSATRSSATASLSRPASAAWRRSSPSYNRRHRSPEPLPAPKPV